MSRITFSDQYGHADLCGRERAYMGVLCGDVTMGILRPVIEPRYGAGDDRRPLLLDAVPAESYLHRSWQERPEYFAKDVETWLRVGHISGDERGFMVPSHGGEIRSVDSYDLCLNTVIDACDTPMRLLARIHAQCEGYAWIAPEHRAWAADVIEEGRRRRIYRGPQALRDWGLWEGVVAFLRDRDDCPVALTYSVTESFPSAGFIREHLGDDPFGDDEESFYDLSEDTQWRLGWQAVAAREASFREMYENYTYQLHPDTIGEVGFSSGATAFTVIDYLYSQKPVEA